MRRTKWIASGAATLAAAAMIMAACSTSERSVLAPTHPSLAFVGTPGDRAVEGERLEVCKEFANQTGGTANFTVSGTLNGNPISSTNFSVNDGACLEVWVVNVGETAVLTVTETSPTSGFTTTVSGIQRTNGVNASFGPTTATSKQVNVAGGGTGAIITFTNTPIVTTGCTFTKGYWRNHPAAVAAAIASLGGTITVGGQTLTAAQAQAILDATPGQPGSITFTSNLLLNAAQQLISAILNGGTSAISSTITSAQSHIVIAANKTDISSNPADFDWSTLVGQLSNFNEGNVTGWPHCPD
jgi:hypothetical protein